MSLPDCQLRRSLLAGGSQSAVKKYSSIHHSVQEEVFCPVENFFHLIAHSISVVRKFCAWSKLVCLTAEGSGLFSLDLIFFEFSYFWTFGMLVFLFPFEFTPLFFLQASTEWCNGRRSTSPSILLRPFFLLLDSCVQIYCFFYLFLSLAGLYFLVHARGKADQPFDVFVDIHRRKRLKEEKKILKRKERNESIRMDVWEVPRLWIYGCRARFRLFSFRLHWGRRIKIKYKKNIKKDVGILQ